MIGNPIKWFITITNSCTSSVNFMWKWWLHFPSFVSKWRQSLGCTLIHSRHFSAVLLQVQFSPSVYYRALMGRWGTTRVVQLQGRSLCCPGWPEDYKTLPFQYLMASGNPSHRSTDGFCVAKQISDALNADVDTNYKEISAPLHSACPFSGLRNWFSLSLGGLLTPMACTPGCQGHCNAKQGK